MNYAVAIGGLLGTGALAYAIFGAETLYPRWKRWMTGAVGLGLAATFWIVQPTFDFNEGEGGFWFCDPWDGGKFDPSC